MFITFEGIDGSGKSTAIKKLKDFLIKNNLFDNFVFTREPGGTGVKEAEYIREFVLSNEYDIDPMSEALLYLTSRNIHLTKIILPALKMKKIVICDRFIDSSLAYQGAGRGLGIDKIALLNSIVTNDMKPNLTFFIKTPPQIAFNRVASQSDGFDRIESEGVGFYEKISSGYEEIIKKDKNRFIIIDGELDKEEVAKKIIKKIMEIINTL